MRRFILLLAVALAGCPQGIRGVDPSEEVSDGGPEGEPGDGGSGDDGDGGPAAGCPEEPCNTGQFCDVPKGICVDACVAPAAACDRTCALCPDGATATGCDGGRCIATGCAPGASPCAGVCARCPGEGGVLQTGCAGDECIAARCADNQVFCGRTCCALADSSPAASPPGASEPLDVAITRDGSPILLTTGAAGLVVVHVADGGIALDVGVRGTAHVAPDPDGRALVGWFDAAAGKVGWSAEADGGFQAHEISAGAVQASPPVLADGADGKVRAAWVEGPDSAHFSLRFLSDLVAGGAPETVENPVAGYPHLAVDAGGRAHVAYGGSGGTVRYAVRSDGAWNPVTAASTGTAAGIALAPDGTPVVLVGDSGPVLYRWNGTRFEGRRPALASYSWLGELRADRWGRLHFLGQYPTSDDTYRRNRLDLVQIGSADGSRTLLSTSYRRTGSSRSYLGSAALALDEDGRPVVAALSAYHSSSGTTTVYLHLIR